MLFPIYCCSQDGNIKYLDSMLSVDYCQNSYDFDSVYFLPDYGCYFDIRRQKIGLTNVFLIPKSKGKIYDFDFSKKSIKWIKANFKLMIFLTEKKYLKEVKNGEGRYAEMFPYVNKLYSYNSQKCIWQLEKTFIIKNLNEKKTMVKSMWQMVFQRVGH